MNDYRKELNHIEQIKQSQGLKGRSLFLFSAQNPLRRLASLITRHFLFEAAIIAVIIISAVQLALENPLEDPNSTMMRVLKHIDWVSSAIFFTEAVMKIISTGFYFCGEGSYLRNRWNILDFLIVVSSAFDTFSDANVSFLKVFRILRVLRPLRLVTRVKSLRLALASLFKAFPSIFKLQVIVLFFLFSAGVFLSYLKSGAFSHCQLEHTGLSSQQMRDLIKDKWDCLHYGGEWVLADQNFDNAFQSTLNTFIMQTRENHHVLMWSFVDAVGVDMEPQENQNLFFCIVLILMIVLFGLLFINMFVGVVITSFNREQDQIKLNHLLN